MQTGSASPVGGNKDRAGSLLPIAHIRSGGQVTQWPAVAFGVAGDACAEGYFLQRLSSPGQTQVDYLWKSLLLKKTTTEKRRSGKRGSAGLFASLALTMDKGKGVETTQPVLMSEGSPLWEGHGRTQSELGRPLPLLCLTTAGAFQFLY